MKKRILHPRIDGGPPRIRRKPVVGKLNAVDLAAIERIVERAMSGRFAGLKATISGRRGGCG